MGDTSTGDDGLSGRRQDSERLLAFAEFAQALAVAADTLDVARSVRNHLATSLGATFANLGLVDAELQVLHMDHPDHLRPDVAERYASIPLDAQTPLTDAARSGRAIIIENRDVNAARYPDLADDTEAAGLHATASVPLIHDGAVCGVLGVAWDDPIDSVDDLLDQLTAIAQLTAGTVARTRITDLQAAFITELQQHLLPTLPAVVGLDIAVRHRAAGAGFGFGGDWYDVIRLDDHRTVVIVGDIVGHGIEAAARMAVVRTAVNTVVRKGTPLAEAVATADPVINGGDPTMIGTAIICVIDQAEHTIRYLNAGHPPAVLCHPDGSTRQLEGANGQVLGVPDTSRAHGTAGFPPGSTLVAYTDGLVERRREGIDAGITRVSRSLAACHSIDMDADATAQAILETTGDPADLADDIALVVVHHRVVNT